LTPKLNEKLRPDVAECLERLVQTTALPATWSDYQRAKLRLSTCCGWDAPKNRFEQKQYDLALKTFLEAVDL